MAKIMRRFVPLTASAFLLAGCATRVDSYAPPPSAETANLPRPRRVLVTDFTVAPGAVREDQGIGPRLQRQFEGGNSSAADRATAAEVQSAISDTLVAALAKSGLPAQHASANTTFMPGDLVVTGQILRIDEGNRTRRMGVGFGAGKSEVEAVADVSAIVPNGPPVLLQRDDGSADSGRKPGMGVGASMAVAQSSAAVGTLSAVTNVGGEVRRSPAGKEAASLGNRLATNIGRLAAEHGWIAEAAVPPWQR